MFIPIHKRFHANRVRKVVVYGELAVNIRVKHELHIVRVLGATTPVKE